MYDKYSKANTFPLGTKLGAHKGFLFSATSAGVASLSVLNTQGNTATVNLPFGASSSNFVPLQAYSVISLAAGVTGWMLN